MEVAVCGADDLVVIVESGKELIKSFIDGRMKCRIKVGKCIRIKLKL